MSSQNDTDLKQARIFNPEKPSELSQNSAFTEVKIQQDLELIAKDAEIFENVLDGATSEGSDPLSSQV